MYELTELHMSAAFAGLLLSIAALPLLAAHWWESNRNKGIVAVLWSVPVLIWLLKHGHGNELGHTAMDYLGFMSVIAPLYMAAGGVSIQGQFKARPGVNTSILAIGSLVSAIIGTLCGTLLTMFLLRKVNANRKNVVHTYLFTILIVSNLGGLLMAVGPPLFLAYQKGIAFEWFPIALWKYWLIIKALQLGAYYMLEVYAYANEPQSEVLGEYGNGSGHGATQIVGWANLLILAAMVVAIASAIPPVTKMAVLWVFGGISFFFAPGSKTARTQNKYSWHPVVEVGVLFAGIFLAMIPALMYLQQHGNELGLQTPTQFYLATGILSGFLDNAPTLLCFLQVGMSTYGAGSPAELAASQPLVVTAMCLGAVQFGALSYIGNAPNFIVRAMAEESGVRMPNFFLYIVYAAVALMVTTVLPTILLLQMGGL